MSSRKSTQRCSYRAVAAPLLLLACQFLGAGQVLAQACSDFGGVLDGDAGDIAPATLEIDQACTIRNYPATSPIATNLSFAIQPGPVIEDWLVTFDNVEHTGLMTCGPGLGHSVWLANSNSNSIEQDCNALLVDIEKVEIENPAGVTTASVGVPFTWTLTLPTAFDPQTDTIVDASGSPNVLSDISVTNDLNNAGAALSYVSHTATRQSDGTPVAHNFVNAAGALSFDGFADLPAGEQIVIALTVVLDDVPANVNGTAFSGSARWNLTRDVAGVSSGPLPGEGDMTAAMTIAGPELVLRKFGPPLLNLGELGTFRLEVRNIGNFAAWNATIEDQLPLLTGGTPGGMCDFVPVVQSAQVFAADGVTPVPGKPPLVAGTDYSLTWNAAPQCTLYLTTLSAASAVGPGERLIIDYQSALDAVTANGAALTNVAGVTEWFNADVAVATRQNWTRVVTDGTAGTLNLDHEDSHTLAAALSGAFFNKTVENVTRSQNPALTATPGDVLRYTLHVRTTDAALNDFSIVDDLGALNPAAVFEPGTLNWVVASLPAGADTSNTNPVGGTNSTGLADIRDLDLAADSEVSLQFEVQLQSVLTNGIYATNQATLTAAGGYTDYSDDPAVNGQASPDVADDEDPTQVRIVSAPYFDVDKVSSYPDGDPLRLLAGERLYYTITVANIGTDNATDAVIRDQVPANTAYVPGSTTLNGNAVADPLSGVAPLAEGIAINAVGTGVAGSLPADAAAPADNVATIEFAVLVDANAADGTIISNQAFVSALAGGVADVPSDDPRTELVNDPTRDVLGDRPLLFAAKSAELVVDFGTPNVVDPGDTLRYTITVYNNGVIPATQAVLTDAVPSNTTYVADSTTLNGEALGSDGGVSPLADGLPISTSDLTPPLPADGDGTLTPGESAVVQFDALVDDGLPPGTLIVNQANLATYEVPILLSDGDGNPATGPEPTVVVVGPLQLLSITKQAAVVGGGPAYAGSTLEYTVRVLNIGQVPALYVRIYDDLDVPVPGYLSYVADSATMNGLTDGVVFAGSLLTADYSAEYGALDPGAEIIVRFQATLDMNLVQGTIVTNTAEVQWADPTQTASASVSVTIGGVPGAGVLSGSAWHDTDFDDVFDSAENALESWLVDLYRAGQLIHTAQTSEDGFFRITGVSPSTSVEDRYSLIFRAPDAGPDSAALGRAFSDFENGLQRIDDIAVDPGANLPDLHLPIDPNGVVFNTLARAPLPGATVTMRDALTGDALPEACFDDPNQQGQVTRGDGFYKFDINFSDLACPQGADYRIDVSPPVNGFWIGPTSEIIPPSSSATEPLSLPDCIQGGAADAIPATTLYCEASDSGLAPGAAVASQSAGTAYYLHLTLDNTSNPGSRQIFNNHIPLDPDLRNSVRISKTTPLVSVRRGDLVPYLITVSNDVGFDISEVSIVDRFPAGFRYVEGSARLDGVEAEPIVLGTELTWSDLGLAGAGTREIELLFAVGSGVSEGEFVNRAQVVHALSGTALSSQGSATVRLVPDPDFDCTDVMGKVFDDVNRNGVQDEGEDGIPGVRLVTANGLAASTDAYGRYHITCATIPNESRGSNFVVKLDDRTLPSGFRPSGNGVLIERATRGKALRFNFGASIHRVIGIDLSDPIFEIEGVELRPQWRGRVDILLDQMQSSPSILRISYLADLEQPGLVRDRMNAFEALVRDRWEGIGDYELEIEPEIFWRRGGPVDQPASSTRRQP